MGSCLSKKELQKNSSPSKSSPHPDGSCSQQHKDKIRPQAKGEEKEEEEKETVKKEVLTAANPKKKSQEKAEEKAESNREETKEECCNGTNNIRTSSCTKEEIDAILIQCGRLSRNSSGKGGGGGASHDNTNNPRSLKTMYAGSKRSYDFENDSIDKKDYYEDNNNKAQSARIAHRRTPSRERDELKRSGSRERSGGRRSSRSPGRRTEPPIEKPRTAKIVSVPATARETGTTSIKRVSTKRSGEGGLRSSASPRSRSPANTRASNENSHLHHPQPSLSRSSSRKAEQSPYRRNPMKEIDENILKTEHPALKNQEQTNNKILKNKECEEGVNKASHSQSQESQDRNVEILPVTDSSNSRGGIREQLMSFRTKDQQLEAKIPDVVEAKEPMKNSDIATTETPHPQIITRTRSSRRSRDLDLNLDTLLNPSSSYASQLLEDIQNYHQQNTAFSLPPCVSKACSILEAVADLNSCTNHTHSSTFSEDKSSAADHRSNGRLVVKEDPFVESEVVVNDDDLMEPSLHKYVTVRDFGGDSEQQESAGSNSFLGYPWASSWEPNSADSTDHWTSLSNTGEEVEQQALTETTNRELDAGGRRLKRGTNNRTMSGKKREYHHSQSQHHQGGSGGNGKVGVRSFSLPIAAAR
ncbi:uncharacterized protein At1g65710-like [Tasmannia lanceolata]|uniref:uncharacterized protein At1g65710-like n=1 Tax=Tasmannia lanceolata TaxID=3420 RepID=UPI00406366F0